ncbi:ABC transporter substrate-binding protein [Thermodesulforhabdus norvegica]|uniref:Branched-chain amino acid transport system substrate-binding protein n=1 Tax=Thermodesulforhabdus norvegica TaxID=39841 RepID=A0A1I4W3T9_9BACT|nr:ABC transporter substrate-binding protein [Thermodesulforhabdus norvegica]SFN07930.1 branched-chain amino acid transport system substrate-binding protein [Thermodesulforhabdus norvegica]
MLRKMALLCSVFMLVGIACTGMAGAEDTIKLGVVEPLSGTFKDIGERYLEGVEYAVKVINDGGGLLGRKVEVIPIDSEVKPDVAVRKATKLIMKDNVKFFCGGTGSSVGAAMSELVEKHKGIFFTYGMDASSLTGEKCNRHFFRPGGSTDGRSYALALWAVRKGYKRIAGIAQDYSFGHEAMAAFKKKIKELDPNIELVAEIYHPLGNKDYAPYISQIIAAKPDVIFTPNWGNDLSLLLKQGRSMGLNVKFLCYYINDDVLIKGLGDDEAVIGSVGAEIYMLSIPGRLNQEFLQGFFKEKGYYPSWLRGKAYTATLFWAEAVKKAGSADPEKVISAWEGLTFEGPAGTWYMRPCDHQAQVPYWIAEVVKENKFYDHAYVGEPVMIPAKEVEVPCEETGCKMSKSD